MTDPFASKMTTVLEYATTGESEAAYREINLVFDKKKGLTKITPNQTSVALMIKAFCQVRLNLYGEANANFEGFVKTHKTYPEEGLPYLRVFTVLATHLKRTKDAKLLLEELAKLKPQDPQIADFLLFISLADWDFMSVQKQFMKMYKDSNSAKDFVASLATQYLNLAKDGDEYLTRADAGKVKILNMMIAKAETVALEEKDKDAGKLALEQLLHLKGEVLWDLKDYKGLLQLFKTKLQSGEPNVYEFSEYLGPLKELAADDQLFATHRQDIEEVFLVGLETQLKKEAPVASYAPQNAFILQMFKRATEEDFKRVDSLLREEKITSVDSFIEVLGKKEPQGLCFYAKLLRLLSQYIHKLKVVQKDKFRSKNYLLHTLQILQLVHTRLGGANCAVLPLATSILSLLVASANSTLTVVDELQGFESFRGELLKAVQHELAGMTTDHASRCTLGYQEMCLRFLLEVGDAHTAPEAHVVTWINLFFAQYEEYETVFYKDQEKIRLEKGERLAHDNYLLGAVELIRLLENRQPFTAEGFIKKSQLRVLLFLILEYGKRSIYNFDLMLRHLEVNQNLCLFEENADLFIKHDIKGNQYDTLAYLFYKTILAVPLPHLAYKYTVHGMDYFRECEKESIESFRKCCKHGNMKVLNEFYLYNKLVEHSVSRVIFDQVNAEQNLYFSSAKTSSHASNLSNSSYLLERNVARLRDQSFKPSLNWDLVHVQPPLYFTSKVFNFDLAGVLKDKYYLRSRAGLTLVLAKLLHDGLAATAGYLTKEVIEQLRSDVSAISAASTFSFSHYKVFRRVNNPIESAAGKEPLAQMEIESQVTSSKVSLEALFEFVQNISHFLSEDQSKLAGTDLKKLQTAKLQELKALVSDKVSHLLVKSAEGAIISFNSLTYYEIHQALHVFKLIASTYAEISADVKSVNKKLLASKDEGEKQSVSALLANYSELRDFVKQKQQAMSTLLDNIPQTQVVPDIAALQLGDIKLSGTLAKSIPKLLETYRTKLRYSCADTVSRVTNLAKF